jgi:hypothetical protein
MSVIIGRILTTATLLVAAGGASAQATLDSNSRPQRCESIGDAYTCQQWGCYWDRYYGCTSRQPRPQRCENIGDYYTCRQYNCFWDDYYGCTTREGGGLWQCTARDQGWEEHWGGHSGQGYSQAAAAQAALGVCQKPYGPHDRCTVTECERL